MKPHAKTALSLALAIVGGIAAGLRCDASEWVENSPQTNPRPAAYTVKAYTEGSPDPFDAFEVYVCVYFAENLRFQGFGCVENVVYFAPSARRRKETST